VAPPTAIEIPPLRVWTFIPVTSQIISRQVIVEDGTTVATPGKQQRKESPQSPQSPETPGDIQGSGSALGTKLPSVVQPKGNVVTPGKRKAQDDEGDGDDGEGDDGDDGEGGDGDVDGDLNIEDELAKLEALQGKGRKKKEEGANPKKKPRKKE
jgi:hypothetical protein